jgi:hypothetical protein
MMALKSNCKKGSSFSTVLEENDYLFCDGEDNNSVHSFILSLSLSLNEEYFRLNCKRNIKQKYNTSREYAMRKGSLDASCSSISLISTAETASLGLDLNRSTSWPVVRTLGKTTRISSAYSRADAHVPS